MTTADSASEARHALGWHHYRALGLKVDATADDIKLRYRKLALLFHPDKNPGNEDKFKLISEAYACLSDVESRRRYDERGDLNYSQEQQQRPTQHMQVDWDDLRREWMIWLVGAFLALLLARVLALPIDFLAVFLASFYAAYLYATKWKSIAVMLFLDIFLAVLLPLPLLAPIAIVAVACTGSVWMNRLTIQIDFTALSMTVVSFIAVLIQSTINPYRISTLDLLHKFLAAHALISSVYALNRARIYYLAYCDLLSIQRSFLSQVRHELYVPIGMILFYMPLCLWTRLALSQIIVVRAAWVFPIFSIVAIASNFVLIELFIARQWKAVSQFAGVYLIAFSVYFVLPMLSRHPAYIDIGISHLCLLSCLATIIRRISSYYDPASYGTEYSVNYISSVIGVVLVFAIVTWQSSEIANRFTGDTLFFLPAPFVALFAAFSLVIQTWWWNTVPHPGKLMREWIAKASDRLSAWVHASHSSEDPAVTSASRGGFFSSGAAVHSAARWDSVAKNKAKEKNDPNYKSSRELKREAQREQKRSLKKDVKLSATRTGVSRPLHPRFRPKTDMDDDSGDADT